VDDVVAQIPVVLAAVQGDHHGSPSIGPGERFLQRYRIPARRL
jgi:hypothetical protein